MKRLTDEERAVQEMRTRAEMKVREERIKCLESGTEPNDSVDYLRAKIELDRIELIQNANMRRKQQTAEPPGIREVRDRLPDNNESRTASADRLYAITFNLMRREVGNERYQQILNAGRQILRQKQKREAFEHEMKRNGNTFAGEEV